MVAVGSKVFLIHLKKKKKKPEVVNTFYVRSKKKILSATS